MVKKNTTKRKSVAEKASHIPSDLLYAVLYSRPINGIPPHINLYTEKDAAEAFISVHPTFGEAIMAYAKSTSAFAIVKPDGL